MIIPDRSCHVRSRGFWWRRPRWRGGRERGGQRHWPPGQSPRREGNAPPRWGTSSFPSPSASVDRIGRKLDTRKGERGDVTWMNELWKERVIGSVSFRSFLVIVLPYVSDGQCFLFVKSFPATSLLFCAQLTPPPLLLFLILTTPQYAYNQYLFYSIRLIYKFIFIS